MPKAFAHLVGLSTSLSMPVLSETKLAGLGVAAGQTPSSAPFYAPNPHKRTKNPRAQRTCAEGPKAGGRSHLKPKIKQRNAIHKLPTLLKAPHTLPYVPTLVIHLIPLTSTLHSSPAHVNHLRAQLANILHLPGPRTVIFAGWGLCRGHRRPRCGCGH